MGNTTFLKRYGALLDSAKQREKELAAKAEEVRKQDEAWLEACRAEREAEERRKKEMRIVDNDERLREYQQKAVKEILTAWYNMKSVMLQMPTGTDKTRLFVALINALSTTEAENYKVVGVPRFLIVTHREELVEQISETLRNHYHLNHKILGRKEASPQPSPVERESETTIFVSSIQYMSRQLKVSEESGARSDFDFIIIDEAHHSLAESYKLLWKAYPKAYKLGVTATPYRLRGSSFKGLYEKLLKSQKISSYIEQGYLADYRFFTVSSEQAALQKVNRLTKVNVGGDYQIKDLQEIYANNEEIAFLYDCYKQHTLGKRGIIYAVNQLHAEMIASYFGKKGVSIANIDSKTASARRKELIAQFRSGELQVLVNVELFGEGFDCPAIEFAMLARPTKSLAMYLQQVGRALRPMPSESEKLKVKSEKSNSKVIILDCVRLYNCFGLLERERNWDAHFSGNKVKDETYTMKLGLNMETESMIEIDTPRIIAIKQATDDKKRETLTIYCYNGLYGIRNALGERTVAAIYVKLTQVNGEWFYGRDEDGKLVIFNKKGVLVFKNKNCDIDILESGMFYILMRAIDGVEYKIGPYKNMFIEGRFLDMQEIMCGWYESPKKTDAYYMDFYIQKDNAVIMTSPHLSLNTLFFRKQLLFDRRIYVFADMENITYGVKRDGKAFPMQPLWSDSAERIAKGYKKL